HRAYPRCSSGNGGGTERHGHRVHDELLKEQDLSRDCMSGRYAEFVETEVLPLVESLAHVKLTHDPDGRATMGGSSGGACALIMAWYHPELYTVLLAIPEHS